MPKIIDRIKKAKERGAQGQYHIFGTREDRVAEGYNYAHNTHTMRAASQLAAKLPDGGIFSNAGCLIQGHRPPPNWTEG